MREPDHFYLDICANPITFVTRFDTHGSVQTRRLCHHAQKADMPTTGYSAAKQVDTSPSGSSQAANTDPAEKAVFCADLNGEFVGCNAAFTRWFGYAPQELTGRDFSALFISKEKNRSEEHTSELQS